MDLASNILHVKMKFSNLRPLCYMPRPEMMRISWTLRGRLQCILARRLLQKNDDNEMKKKSPKVMNTLYAHI